MALLQRPRAARQRLHPPNEGFCAYSLGVFRETLGAYSGLFSLVYLGLGVW